MSYKKNTYFGFSTTLLILLFLWALPNISSAQLANFKKVTITPVETIAPQCGKFYLYSVNFDVENANHQGGWVIQEITLTRWQDLCPPQKELIIQNSKYYEAWWVPAGKTRPIPDDNTLVVNDGAGGNWTSKKANDIFWCAIPNDTRGEWSWQGRVAFVEDPGRTMIVGGGWGLGTVSWAGTKIHSTRTQPPFWGGIAAFLKKHNAYVKWVCCGANPVFDHKETEDAPVATPPAVVTGQDPVPDNTGNETPDTGGNGGEEVPPTGGEGNGATGHSDIPTSLGAINLDQSFIKKVYPNPASGTVYLDLSISKDDSSVELTIIDLMGRVVEMVNYQQVSQSLFRAEADMAAHQRGMYYVMVKVDGLLVGTRPIMIE